MPDKKLTDSEIVKALECCMDEMGCTKGCPCFDPKAKGSHCTVSKKLELEKLTLDLINRLQAKIDHNSHNMKNLVQSVRGYQKALEQAKTEKDVMIHYIDHFKAENERSKDYIATLEKEVDWYRDELRHSDKKVANKAYKEVFEKINEKAEVRKIKIFGGLHILKVVLLHDINELKHEMVGEDNGKM